MQQEVFPERLTDQRGWSGKSGHVQPLQSQQTALFVYPSGIAGEAAVGAYHTVAGHDQGNGVVSHRAAHRLGGI